MIHLPEWYPGLHLQGWCCCQCLLRSPPVQEEEDENAEADADMEEGKLQWAGGRKEAATYDEGEVEDKQIAAASGEAASLEGGIEVKLEA